jgi:ferritin
MLAKKVEGAMNKQLAVELQSAYVYLAMSAYCESEGLGGSARWLRVQAEEEVEHGMRFYTFITDRGGRVLLEGMPKPRRDYNSALDVFERALEHERSVSRSINDLYALVVDQRDFAAQAWLDWFATEQVEEEKSVGQIVDSLRRIGTSGDALYFLDKDLGSRGE